MKPNPLNKTHIAVLEAIDRGDNPPIYPLMRAKLIRERLIVPVEPPRSPHNRVGRVRPPAPRRHALTVRGREVLADNAADGGAALKVPVTGYLSDRLKRMVTR